ncbi:MAG: hypothetical protein R3331_00590 [Sulfurospirillaceae bacterium]|nr:hypothetical protein [Sulfurospirillaceae bacterium]
MKIALIAIIALFFSGCIYVNNRGISTQYYNECHEYYDGMGIYHKDCDKNLIEYKGVKKDIKKTYKAIAD